VCTTPELRILLQYRPGGMTQGTVRLIEDLFNVWIKDARKYV